MTHKHIVSGKEQSHINSACEAAAPILGEVFKRYLSVGINLGLSDRVAGASLGIFLQMNLAKLMMYQCGIAHDDVNITELGSIAFDIQKHLALRVDEYVANSNIDLTTDTATH